MTTDQHHDHLIHYWIGNFSKNQMMNSEFEILSSRPSSNIIPVPIASNMIIEHIGIIKVQPATTKFEESLTEISTFLSFRPNHDITQY